LLGSNISYGQELKTSLIQMRELPSSALTKQSKDIWVENMHLDSCIFLIATVIGL